MPEDNTELKKTPPVREVRVGEWFNPFVNYDELTDHGDALVAPVTIKPLGKFHVVTERMPEEYFSAIQVLTLPFDEKYYNEKSFKPTEELEREIESRLHDIAVDCDDEKYTGKNLPYQVEIQLPSGKVFRAAFQTDTEIDTPVAWNWHDNKGVRMHILVPKVGNILEKIQMRIVPTEEGKNG